MLFFWSLLFVLLIPFQFALSIGEEDIPLLRILALVLVFFFLVRAVLLNQKIFPSLLFGGLFIGWLGITLLSVLFAEAPFLGTRKLLFLWNLFPLALVWYTVLAKTERMTALLKGLIFGAVASALIGIGIFATQFFFGVASIFHFLTEKVLPIFLGERLALLVAAYPSLLVNIDGETWLRVTAFFPDPHVASFFFGMTACLAFGLFLDTRQRVFLFSTIILFLADLLTFSRGGYLGLLTALILFTWMNYTRTRWKATFFFIVMALLPLVSFLAAPVYERFVSTFFLMDASSTERLLLWKTAGEALLTHPWLGLGLGNYAEWVHPGVGTTLPYYAHNLYLDIAVESGLLGLGFFLGFLFVALSRALAEASQGSGLAIGILAALVLYLTHSLFETALFSLAVTSLLTLLIALPFGALSRRSPVQ